MEILISILAAAGAVTFLWCLAGLLFLPVAGDGMVTVWRLRGPCPGLEIRVRGHLWLQRTGLVGARLALVDCGMTEADRAVAERLARNTDLVDLIPDGSLDTYMDLV